MKHTVDYSNTEKMSLIDQIHDFLQHNENGYVAIAFTALGNTPKQFVTDYCTKDSIVPTLFVYDMPPSMQYVNDLCYCLNHSSQFGEQWNISGNMDIDEPVFIYRLNTPMTDDKNLKLLSIVEAASDCLPSIIETKTFDWQKIDLSDLDLLFECYMSDDRNTHAFAFTVANRDYFTDMLFMLSQISSHLLDDILKERNHDVDALRAFIQCPSDMSTVEFLLISLTQ